MNNYNQKLFESMNNNAPNLVSKNIDDYFNKLLNDINSDTKVNDKPSFYTTYIEHNILLIVILIFIAIFLFFRYYSKKSVNKGGWDGDGDGGSGGGGGDGGGDGNGDGGDGGNGDIEKKEKSKKKKKKIIKKHIDNELKLLYEEKKALENEKKSLLNIIDDLSNYNVKNDADIKENFTDDYSTMTDGGGAGGKSYNGRGGGNGGMGGNGGNGGMGGNDVIEGGYEEYNSDTYNHFLDINSSNTTKVNNINIENPYI
jgi:hypothetical protein